MPTYTYTCTNFECFANEEVDVIVPISVRDNSQIECDLCGVVLTRVKFSSGPSVIYTDKASRNEHRGII